MFVKFAWRLVKGAECLVLSFMENGSLNFTRGGGCCGIFRRNEEAPTALNFNETANPQVTQLAGLNFDQLIAAWSR